MPHVIGIVGFLVVLLATVVASLVVTMRSCTSGLFTPQMLAIVVPNVGLALFVSTFRAWYPNRRSFDADCCDLDDAELPVVLIAGAVFAVAHGVVFGPCAPIYASLAVGILSASLIIITSTVALPLMLNLRRKWEMRKDIAEVVAETERCHGEREQFTREALEAHIRACEMEERAAAEARERAAALAASVAPVRAQSPRRRRAH